MVGLNSVGPGTAIAGQLMVPERCWSRTEWATAPASDTLWAKRKSPGSSNSQEVPGQGQARALPSQGEAEGRIAHACDQFRKGFKPWAFLLLSCGLALVVS